MVQTPDFLYLHDVAIDHTVEHGLREGVEQLLTLRRLEGVWLGTRTRAGPFPSPTWCQKIGYVMPWTQCLILNGVRDVKQGPAQKSLPK